MTSCGDDLGVFFFFNRAACFFMESRLRTAALASEEELMENSSASGEIVQRPQTSIFISEIYSSAPIAPDFVTLSPNLLLDLVKVDLTEFVGGITLLR